MPEVALPLRDGAVEKLTEEKVKRGGGSPMQCGLALINAHKNQLLNPVAVINGGSLCEEPAA